MKTPGRSPRLIFQTRSALAVALLALAAFASLRAQAAPTSADSADSDVVQLDKLDVAGFRDQDYASTLSTGALKTATPLVETPQSISVITRFQIEDQAAQNMQEVLRYAAGVRAEMYGLDNRGDWFTMRGGSEGSTLLDGLRLPLTGWWGVVRNEPYAFERVEVLRGPASVIAGQNGPGGVVNLVSKRPQSRPAGEFNVQYGNRNHRQAAFDFTGPLAADGTVLYRLVGLARDADTQVEHAFDKRQFLAPSLTWRPSQATTLTVYLEHQRDESGNTEGFFPWEGTLFPAPNGFIPSETFIGEPEWDTYGGRRLRAGYELEQRIGTDWTLRHHLRHDYVKGELRTMYAAWWTGFVDAHRTPNPNGRYLDRIWYANDDIGRITNADLLAEGKLTFGSTRHTVLLGLDSVTSTNSQKSLEGEATPLDVYTPTYGTFPLPLLTYDPAVETRTRQFGILAQDQIKFDERWVLVVGLRHDRVKTTVDGSVADGTNDSAWSKNLGLVYLGRDGWSPYLNYAESFEGVSGTDANDIAFKPKRGTQLEAGLKWAPKDGRIAASAAAFTLEEQNRLTTDPSNPLNSVQGGEVTVNGFELETMATLGAWSFVGNYTFTDAKTTASSDPSDPTLDKQLASIPEHSVALWTTHTFAARPLRGLRTGFGVRYVGETWDGTDTVRTPSNTLFDALISYDRGRWHYALNASNLFDKTYIATALTRGDAWFGPRRKIVGTVSYRW